MLMCLLPTRGRSAKRIEELALSLIIVVPEQIAVDRKRSDELDEGRRSPK